MTIDKEKLKALAERAITSNPPGGDGNPFPALAIRAVDVLALIAEIEQLALRLSKSAEELFKARKDDFHLVNERDQLKAENEALRKDAQRYRWLRDDAGYCDTRDIPGMAPARMDAFIDAAMTKEEPHG